MIFLELTDLSKVKIMVNPSSIETILENGDHACIVLKSGEKIITQANYEEIKVILKRALRRSHG